MAVLAETVKKTGGLTVHVVKTEKYKTNTLVFKMKAPISGEEISLRALLPYVLQSNSKKFPTTAKLRSYLDDLYGANFFVDLAKKGEYHIISFTLEIANEKFLTEQIPLLKKGMEFLAEILTNPNVQNGAFDKETVEKEKRTLKQRIQSIYDDKIKYANTRLVEEMCKGEKYAVPVYGGLEDVDQITPEKLYAYYEKAFREDELDLYCVGDVTAEEVESICQSLFSFPPRTPALAGERTVKKDLKEKTVKEVQDVKQGKLHIGFRTNTQYGDPDYFALQVFNGIYGGFAHSKLFMNVREKASLAYYAASRLESHKGLMMVMSGIDQKNFDRTVAIIKEQMDAMNAGDFTDEELAQTKAVIKNQMLETIDTPRGLIEVLYHNVVAKTNISLEDWLAGTDKATREDIVKVAGKIQLDTIYFLSGSEGDQ